MPRRTLLSMLLLVLALGPAGCAQAPRGELQRMHASLATVRSAADPLLDDLAIAERRLGRAEVNSAVRAAGSAGLATESGCVAKWLSDPGAARTEGFIGALCPEHMAFFATVADPPGTEALRTGLAALTAATEALLALAENRNLGEAEAEIEQLTGALSGLIRSTATPFGPTSGTADILALLGPVAEALRPLTEVLLKANNARRAQHLVLENEAKLAALITALRQAVPRMFTLFMAELEVRVATAPPPQRAALRAERDRLVEGYRTLLANYDAMLAHTGRAWQQVVAASRAEPGVDLGRAGAAIADARVAAEAVRRAQAAFRTGRAGG